MFKIGDKVEPIDFQGMTGDFLKQFAGKIITVTAVNYTSPNYPLIFVEGFNIGCFPSRFRLAGNDLYELTPDKPYNPFEKEKKEELVKCDYFKITAEVIGRGK